MTTDLRPPHQLAITCPRCGERLIERFPQAGGSVVTCDRPGCDYRDTVPMDIQLERAGAAKLPGFDT